MSKHKVIDYLKTLSFEDYRKPFEVLPRGKVIFMRRGFETIEYKGEYYFHVVTPFFRVLFKDLTIYNETKYSDNKKVQIVIKENEILFISLGNKLEKELDEYFKPFHNDTKAKNHGMGLGLYIVKSIIDMHDFKFDYEYKKGNNIFKIIFN